MKNQQHDNEKEDDEIKSTMPSRIIAVNDYRLLHLDTKESMWKMELKIIFRLAVPSVVGYLFTTIMYTANMSFAGHLGATELAAIALAVMFCNVTGYSLGIGLLSAMDTLCSQAYGAKNYIRVGIILQRALVILGIMCIFISILWLCSNKVLLLAKQDPDVVELSSLYIRIQILALLPYFLFEVMRRYLQAQSIVAPTTVVCFFGVLVTIICDIIFIQRWGLGIVGAALAILIATWSQPLMLFSWIKYKKLHEKTWGGWSKECLKEWKPFFSLGLPGAAMICAEWIGFEIHALISGLLGTIPLAAQTLLMNTLGLAFMFPLGMGIASSIRVGNLLGANEYKSVQICCKIVILLILLITITNGILLFSLRNLWGYVFTSDSEVVKLVSKLMPLISVFVIFDGLQGSCSGILRGSGRQKFGAIVNLSGYWLVALPVGAALALCTKLEVLGQWIGLSIASFCIAMTYILTVLTRIDWKKEALIVSTREASKRDDGSENNIPVDKEKKPDDGALSPTNNTEERDDPNVNAVPLSPLQETQSVETNTQTNKTTMQGYNKLQQDET